jgi:hypothetical protein
MANRLLVLALVLLAAAVSVSAATIEVDADAPPRVRFGREKLEQAIKSAGVDGGRVVIAKAHDAKWGKEGFSLTSAPDGTITITGGDDSGTLYGCLELARRIGESQKLPNPINFSDKPVMVLRGPCIGMQKTNILPGRRVYEYPYTPESFPFFYDKQHWQEFLDFCAANRFNTLYLWNGHPFASLVKLKDYPYAQEVPDDVFEKNVEMFRYVTEEADKRGIWVVQQFYSIILSKPFAEKNGLSTQLSESTPLVDDYMRKSIAEFVRQYPHVGLMPCLGEALHDQPEQTRWLTEVILPGIKQGVAEAGLAEEPPVVIRTHATDLTQAMPAALKVYKNLYTEAKFNGESLTTWEPRGTRQQVHLDMSRLGSTHLINVHILANLEPFRYGAQRFIQKSVQAGRDRLGAKGIHLYPLFYWDWPVSPDQGVSLKQWERDWIWFEAWARYAWNPDVPADEDRAYWVRRLVDRYGTNEAAANILDAYNDSGECAPRILRRFGITEGNRQTMSLGMTLDQLVHPDTYRPWPELWESQSPPGERLAEYAEREWKRQPHEGETPPQIVAEVLEFSRKAVEAIDGAAPHVTRNRDEFERLRNDVRCIHAMSQNYAEKVNAALRVLRYNHSKDPADLDMAASHLAQSLEHYRTLADLTKDTYKFANSMQTSQRKIPFVGGVDGKPANYHWTQLVPAYEKELADFRAKLADLKPSGPPTLDESTIKPLPRATITVSGSGAETYEVKVGERVWTDRKCTIESIAPELVGLTGIRFAHEPAKNGQHTPIAFEVNEPVRVLIGYFKDPRAMWLKVPDLETDARADERGGAEPVLLNAARITESPALDVHALSYPAGKHTLDVKGNGSFVVLGVMPQSTKIEKRDAHRKGGL